MGDQEQEQPEQQQQATPVAVVVTPIRANTIASNAAAAVRTITTRSVRPNSKHSVVKAILSTTDDDQEEDNNNIIISRAPTTPVAIINRPIKKEVPESICSPIEEIEGRRRGSTAFIADNFVYRKQKQDGKQSYFMCLEPLCTGRGVSTADGFRRTKEHSHRDSKVLIQNLRFLGDCKRRAEQEPEELRKIFDEEVLKHGNSSVEFAAVESTLYKRRKKCMPESPSNIAELSQQLTLTTFGKTLSGAPFYTALMQGADDSETLVFIAPWITDVISQVKELHVDGAFRLVPSMFCQLLVMHGVIYNHAFPMVYAIMTKKTENAYVDLFMHIRERFPSLNPDYLVADFDSSLQSALATTFLVEVHGSYFNYCQSIWKKAHSLQLASLYQSNAEVNKLIKMITAAPFLPTDTLDQASPLFRDMLRAINLDEADANRLTSLLVFFDSAWIHQVGAAQLSMFEQEQRANGDVENFNLQLQVRFGLRRPDLWKFLSQLQQQEENSRRNFLRAARGEAIQPKKVRVLFSSKRIQAASKEFADSRCNVTDFLSRLARSVPEWRMGREENEDTVDELEEDPELNSSTIVHWAGPSTSNTIIEEKTGVQIAGFTHAEFQELLKNSGTGIKDQNSANVIIVNVIGPNRAVPAATTLLTGSRAITTWDGKTLQQGQLMISD